MYSVGKVLGSFWLGRDTGRELAICAGGRENSVALQDLGMTRLCLQVLNVYYGMVCHCRGCSTVNTWCLGFLW
jgi:hypothetical protein